MKLTIKPTGQITTLDGRKVRVWEGVTENDVRCHVFVAAVSAAESQDLAEFNRELQSIPPPAESVSLQSISPGRD